MTISLLGGGRIMTETMDVLETSVTLQENMEVVESVRERAFSLPADSVKAPDMPIAVFLDELTTTALAVEEHFDALAAVGFTRQMMDSFGYYVKCLRAAQAVWNAEKSNGRTEDNIVMIEKAENVREDLISASVLALRKNIEGQRRLQVIREGDSMADLVADLQDLGVLITDARPLFEAINMNVDETAALAAKLSKDLQTALSTEDVAKSLSNSKEMRDRVFTLTKENLSEVRLFADFAFRKDKTNNRRSLFMSAYNRRKYLKRKNGQDSIAPVAISA
jgi:hypothetical protein